MNPFDLGFGTPLIAAASMALVLASDPAGAAAPVACAGTVSLTNVWDVSVHPAGPETFVSFDFTGTHDICLADGSLVTGTVAGHLAQRLASDGSQTLHFDEVLSYADGTLGYRGEASSTADAHWDGEVQTVGAGTGVLAGIAGQGSFYPTGPTSFADVIYYVYH